MLDNNDIESILNLIGRAQITGAEAIPVAILVQKLNGEKKTATNDTQEAETSD